jgi:putative ABC transport system substrate-binding protein
MLAVSGARARAAARTYRVGLLSPLSGLAAGAYTAAFREELAKHGFMEGRNLVIESRSPLPGFQAGLQAARELLAFKPDALFATTTVLSQAAHAATGSVPVVFAWVGDPVHSGLVKSFAKPGGNVTGVSNRYFELVAKRLEILRELLPRAKRVAVMAAVMDGAGEEAMKAAQRAADALGFQLVLIVAGIDWRSAIERAAKEGAQAVSLLFPFFAYGMRITAEQFVRSIAERRIPAIFHDSETVEIGGLMSYGTNLASDVRRAAGLLARVLRGERPGGLAIEQASHFELALNLKAAHAIGVKSPPPLLTRADRVIE